MSDYDSFSSPVQQNDPYAAFSSPANTASKQAAPRWDVSGDIKRSAGEAYGALKSDYANASKPITSAGDVGSTAMSFGKSGLDALAYIGSPITGSLHALGGSALASAMEHSPQGVDPILKARYGDPKVAADRLMDLTAMSSPFSGGESLAVSAPRMAASALPISPADHGMDYVNKLLLTSGKTPADLRAAAASGKPITTAEAIGKPGEVAVGALARREGATPDALAGAVQARSASAPQRILSDYAAASGINPLAARGDIEGFIETNQKAADPLYTDAYKENQNISSPMLDRILETPAGKRALAAAREKMQNDMSLMGTPDEDLMSQAAEGGTQLPAKGAASGMKLRVYDYVKRSLDDQISAAYRAGNKNEGNIINALKTSLVKQLDKADVTAAAGPNSVRPEGGLYAQARAKAGEYLSAQKQYEAGQEHILDANFPAKDFSDYYAKLGPADKQAYLGGVANRLFNLQQASKLKADIFKAPVIQQKLATVMGPEKAHQFLSNMESEAKMANFARTRVPGAGSPTAEYAAAMSAQDSPFNMSPGAIDFLGKVADRGPVKGAISYGAGKLKDAGAAWATRGMPVHVRDAAGKLLMADPRTSAALLEARARAAAVQPQYPQLAPPLSPQSLIPYGAFAPQLLLTQRNQ